MESLNIRKIHFRCPETLKWRHFQNPVDVLVTRHIGQVRDLIIKLKNWLTKKFTCGWICFYEASPGFNSKMKCNPVYEFHWYVLHYLRVIKYLISLANRPCLKNQSGKTSLNLEEYIQNIVEIRNE